MLAAITKTEYCSRKTQQRNQSINHESCFSFAYNSRLSYIYIYIYIYYHSHHHRHHISVYARYFYINLCTLQFLYTTSVRCHVTLFPYQQHPYMQCSSVCHLSVPCHMPGSGSLLVVGIKPSDLTSHIILEVIVNT